MVKELLQIDVVLEIRGGYRIYFEDKFRFSAA